MRRGLRLLVVVGSILLVLPGASLRAATWIDVADLTDPGGAVHELFGYAVAIDGDVAVVSHGFYVSVDYPGSVLVFVRKSGDWVEAAELLPSDSIGGDVFGASVAIHGDTIAVGAPTISGSDGIVYVFVRPAGGWSGTLTETARLVGSTSLGERLMLGDYVAFASDSIVTDSSAVLNTLFVFNKPVSGWSGTLTPNAFPYCILNGPGPFHSLAASGDVVVAGAPGETVAGVPVSGRACVWVKPTGGWNGFIGNAAELVPSDPVTKTEFGMAVGVDGDTIVVTRDYEPIPPEPTYLSKGYIFTKPLSGWAGSLTENAQLVASDGQAGDHFGWSAAMSGNTVVIGAIEADKPENGYPFGSAYIFNRPVGGWSGTINEAFELTGPQGGSAVDDEFGYDVAISGNTIVVSSPYQDVGSNIEQGAAHVYELRNQFVTLTRFLVQGPIRVAPGVPVEFRLQVEALPRQTLVQPTGVVVVSDNTGHECRAVVDAAGGGSCSLSFPSAGTFRVRAHYLGNTEFDDSTSPTLPVLVGKNGNGGG
jgi:hypothetical protein